MSNESVRNEWKSRFGREPKIICVGLNYSDHAAEGGRELPKAPILFGKFPTALIAEGDAIQIPADIGHMDSEAELGVVIGDTIKGIAEADALKAVLGYVAANDVSARDPQRTDGQWLRAKGFDTFCPVSTIVELDDASDLRVQQRLNGDTLQDSRTSNMIFKIPFLISYISSAFTLEPGDLILTGTPEGVGVFRDPKISMKPGDVVEVEVEGIGVLRNPVQ